jgi:hypothetical protein
VSVEPLSDLHYRLSGGAFRELWPMAMRAQRSIESIQIESTSSDLRFNLRIPLLVAALFKQYPGSRLALSDPHGLSDLLGLHETFALPALRIVVGGYDAPHVRDARLFIPWSMSPLDRPRSDGFKRALLASGIAASDDACILQPNAFVCSQARSWLRRDGSAIAGPLVLFVPRAGAPVRQSFLAFSELQQLCESRLGATVRYVCEEPSQQKVASERCLPRGPLPFLSGLMAHASVVVAEEGPMAHLAAALALPVLSFVPKLSNVIEPVGLRTVSLKEETFGELSGLSAARVYKHVERLAAQRWPMDRLRMLLP